jgi:hypothetical protein
MIKSLNTSQAIIIAAIIISITYVVSNTFYKVTDIFCGEDCKKHELEKAKNCAKFTSRRTYDADPAYIKTDIYKKCLATKK